MKFIDSILNLERRENVISVSLGKISELKKFHSIELHFILYPYSREINSKDIHFLPFEEYVEDVNSNQLSAYEKITKRFKQFFGFFLGSFIFLAFYFYNPKDLFSAESIVAVFAAYSIGKEIWEDIEKVFIQVSKNWKFRYVEDYYKYTLDENSTMTHYSNLAKKQRYQKDSILPEKLNFLELSNSQTLRLLFLKAKIQKLNSEEAHILSIHIKKEKMKEFLKKGFLFGVKISYNQKKYGILQNLELFQSIHLNKKGCLDENENWHEDKIFYRKAYSFYRLKFFVKRGLLGSKSIFKTLNKLLTKRKNE